MRFLLNLIGLSLIVLTCACGVSDNKRPETAGERRSVVDDLGKTVVLPEKVTRAVSLAPNLTEIVYAVDAGDRLVGVTSYCNFPAETSKIQKVGDTLKPNIETIIALKPDVVLVTTASQLETFTKTLNDQNIAVFVTNPDSLNGIYSSIEKIGAVFDSKGAGQLLANLKGRVEAVEAKTANVLKPRVLVQLDKSLFTIGRGSFLTDLVARAGGVSVTANIEKAYAQLSKESATALDPEVIILSDSTDNREPADVFQNSRALKNKRVYRIDADVMSRPGPRAIDALEQIAAALHPEVFKK